MRLSHASSQQRSVTGLCKGWELTISLHTCELDGLQWHHTLKEGIVRKSPAL